MFHGVDSSIFDSVEERQDFRNKMREEQTKLNWHTIERVNKKQEKNKTNYPISVKHVPDIRALVMNINSVWKGETVLGYIYYDSKELEIRERTFI